MRPTHLEKMKAVKAMVAIEMLKALKNYSIRDMPYNRAYESRPVWYTIKK